MSKRCKIAEAAEILGESHRTIRNQATAGKIPGAAKIFGTWSFNIAMLHAFVAQKEHETSGRARRTKVNPPSPARGSVQTPPRSPTYEQALAKLRLIAKQKRKSKGG